MYLKENIVNYEVIDFRYFTLDNIKHYTKIICL